MSEPIVGGEQSAICVTETTGRLLMSELRMMPLEALERVGTCNRFCGRCCSLAHWQAHPDYETVKATLEAPPFTGMNDRGDCNHLRWVNGMAVCGIYDSRPDICRVFPIHPVSIHSIPTCTFEFRATQENTTSAGGDQ